MKKNKILNFISFFLFFHPFLPAQNIDSLVLEPGFKISILVDAVLDHDYNHILKL